jgi:hypothetical protein
MTNDKTIRVVFIVARGKNRLEHIPEAGAQPGVEAVAVANRTKESGERGPRLASPASTATGGRSGG